PSKSSIKLLAVWGKGDCDHNAYDTECGPQKGHGRWRLVFSDRFEEWAAYHGIARVHAYGGSLFDADTRLGPLPLV
ncbi:MAG: hypothetical protein ACREEG_04305, partial [Phenylobacterium sp.]